MSSVPPVTRRPATAADLAFLYQVYADSRAPEMALVAAWDEAQKAAFLRSQFEAQHTHYHQHYPDAHFDLILRDGQPIGRLYTCRLPGELRLMDIALLAAARGQGIGTALLADLVRAADQSALPVTLYVEGHNPARRLYERLGFVAAGEAIPYEFMRRLPQVKTAS
ncbi:GNAT family N-acetyltransferase [Candidatus Thiodictyon syntrophicum]|jgi:ribosomal protein S18 acetylase RimI-like enzyme|uniref:N-acetyltransferase domain-containing protein n=1 Tax=Candidatus Thiodictyon syntrophicum TaxID=1166950 RepID=A0A2K8U5W9_9GAMM|nr:GNAT family N-acetyltransferase [Candidatus Thiodictyon syntrophicum]AUB80431.1 hypothetical protein THSYN_05350 [Candidatus Thiodictyon syntrophicum]